MARDIDGAVLVVSTLTAFFATFFAVLLLLGGHSLEGPGGGLGPVTPPVDAGPQTAGAPAAVGGDARSESSEPRAGHRTREFHQLLKDLGVKCAEGVDCFGDGGASGAGL